MKVSYLGKTNAGDMFVCQICTHRDTNKYLATPEAESLVDWDKLLICKKCAKREIGNKNVKKWNRIHKQEKSNS